MTNDGGGTIIKSVAAEMAAVRLTKTCCLIVRLLFGVASDSFFFFKSNKNINNSRNGRNSRNGSSEDNVDKGNVDKGNIDRDNKDKGNVDNGNGAQRNRD